MKLRKVRPFRLWYYLRQGYGVYLVFIIGMVNLMTTTYYLAVKNIPYLLKLFPGFTEWILFLIVVGFPLSLGLGYWHMKRSGAQSSQLEVDTEINPYYYKLPPGFWKEVFSPLFLELLRTNIMILQKESLTDEDVKRLKEIEKNLSLLMKGYQVQKDGSKTLQKR